MGLGLAVAAATNTDGGTDVGNSGVDVCSRGILGRVVGLGGVCGRSGSEEPVQETSTLAATAGTAGTTAGHFLIFVWNFFSAQHAD